MPVIWHMPVADDVSSYSCLASGECARCRWTTGEKLGGCMCVYLNPRLSLMFSRTDPATSATASLALQPAPKSSQWQPVPGAAWYCMYSRTVLHSGALDSGCQLLDDTELVADLIPVLEVALHAAHDLMDTAHRATSPLPHLRPPQIPSPP